MQELPAKIQANAAARLPLPSGRQASQELGRYKAFLRVESQRLKMSHRAGAGGLEICQARALVLDLLLGHLWRAVEAHPSEEGLPAIALVALGGYGRRELNPQSDIDVMFLHRGQVAVNQPLPQLSRAIDGVLYPLWDIGLKVGNSTRTVEDCVQLANGDVQSKTALIEARLVAGDEVLFREFQKTLIAKCVEGQESDYIRMRVEDQTERRARFGNSACMQEPNLKNGCGGLRDFQNLLWMAFFKYRTRSLRDLQAREFLSQAERKQLEAAYDFLLRVRTEMHYHANRATEVLGKNLQPAVAHHLGYRDRSPSRRIEAFMRDLYTHSRNIFLITRTLEQRLALLPPARGPADPPDARKRAPETIDGFKILPGQVHFVSPRVFKEQPRRLMRVFLYAQQRGLALHPDLAQLIRNQLNLVDEAFLADEHVRETFLTILGQRGNVAPILRAMHDTDFLGKYLPEFGKLICLVQHEFFHVYAADEHTLMCLEQLDRIWKAKNPPHAAYAQLFQGLERPHLLYLGLLLHDVGKPEGHGNHARESVALALRIAQRLGLDGSATHTLRLLIEHHLLMVSVSQCRDLDDPAVIRRFAEQIQTGETLALLTLHTFADSLATSEKLWNGFKDSLLWSLYYKTVRLIDGGTDFLRAEEKQREQLFDEVRRQLPAEVSREELEAHFNSLPPRYFQIHNAREILHDLLLAHQFMRLQVFDTDHPLTPIVRWQDDPDRACNAVTICTWDRAGLFRKIAGSLSAAGLNILSARIFTRADGILLDTLFVSNARGGGLARREQREQFERLIRKALTGEEVDFHTLLARQKPARPLYQAYSGEHLPTRIRIDNESSDTRTLLEVETEDRVGLLYTISQTLAEFELDISAARIFTEKGAAIDSFYVSELDGSRVLAPERHRRIEERLRHAIAELDRRERGKPGLHQARGESRR